MKPITVEKGYYRIYRFEKPYCGEALNALHCNQRHTDLRRVATLLHELKIKKEKWQAVVKI